ncbi:site-specific DNA-methyltransferase [Flavobacterium sp.]|jgi:DNA modification methylase|uniref:site-specific DNA-methyltransferase n=1 Tax=Flavobacterium sp. TaxID=239 RepID=UPI0037C08DED
MKITKIKIESLKIPFELLEMTEPKKIQSVRVTMLEFGQFQPISVVKDGSNFFVVDGLARLKVAKEFPEQFPYLECVIRTISMKDIKMTHIIENTRGKKSIIQINKELIEILDFIGKQQGKKRDFSKYFNGKQKSNKLDRFDYASLLLDGEYSSSTLRNLNKVYQSEIILNKNERTGVLDLIDSGEISINYAYKLIKEKEERIEAERRSKEAKIISMSYNNSEEKPYKLYCQSSLEMDVIPDETIDLFIDSHPYALSQRTYRNQDKLLHGQEKSVSEYIENFGNFNKEKFKKLKPGGVLVTIIGESYKNGYQGVCAYAQIKLREIGYELIDDVTWEKINQKYTPHNNRFQNVKEQIIIAVKPGRIPTFNLPKKKGSVNNYKAKPTSSGRFYIANPETGITNVIRTPVFNPIELKKIDPNFKHDAPAPVEIYQPFIEAYSKPGDTICDCFVGSGTIGVGLKMGRKVIGFDVDHESIVFSNKRFEYFLNETGENDLAIAV